MRENLDLPLPLLVLLDDKVLQERVAHIPDSVFAVRGTVEARQLPRHLLFTVQKKLRFFPSRTKKNSSSESFCEGLGLR